VLLPEGQELHKGPVEEAGAAAGGETSVDLLDQARGVLEREQHSGRAEQGGDDVGGGARGRGRAGGRDHAVLLRRDRGPDQRDEHVAAAWLAQHQGPPQLPVWRTGRPPPPRTHPRQPLRFAIRVNASGAFKQGPYALPDDGLAIH